MIAQEVGQASSQDKTERLPLATICEQESKKDMGFTLEMIIEPLAVWGYEVLGELVVLKIFDKAGVRKEHKSMAEAYKIGANLVKS